MNERITRRRFQAGLMAAGALAATRGTVFARLGANERIRVGVIGCRTRGWQDAGDFQETGHFDIVTFCDPDEAMIAEGLNALAKQPERKRLPHAPKQEKDYRRVLEDKEIDAVIVAAPDHWHAIMALEALAAGKHVFLEKPASYCINEGKAMVAAQAKYPKLTICVGTQQRSGQHFKDARAFIADGGLGKIGFARAYMIHDRGILPIVPDTDPPATMDYNLWLGPAPWRPHNVSRVHYNWHFMRNTGTGDTGNWGAHWLDSLRHLLDLGLPRSARGHGGRFIVADAKETDDTQTVVFEYPELTVLWEMRLWSKTGPHNRGGGVEIAGEKGSLMIDRGGWTFLPKGGKPEQHGSSDMTGPHVQNFAACIRGEAKPAASIEEGHRSAALCHLVNIVCRIGRGVDFDPQAETIVNDAEAAALMGRVYRSPWKLPV